MISVVVLELPSLVRESSANPRAHKTKSRENDAQANDDWRRQ